MQSGSTAVNTFSMIGNIHSKQRNQRFSLWIYSATVLIIFSLSFVPSYVACSSPYAIAFTSALPPSWEHLFGTDYLGRDVLARTLAGGRIAILIGVISRIASVLVGLAVGLAAGLSGPWLRRAIDFFIEVFLSIPALLLAMALAMVLGEGSLTIFAAIVIGTWAPVARFFSTRVSQLESSDFILAAKALGARKSRIALVHIIPSLSPSLIPIMSTGIATSIMLESTLSFLGLGGVGTLYDLPSWGLMIQEGSRVIFDAPWMLIAPSIFLSVTILCFNQIGDTIAEK